MLFRLASYSKIFQHDGESRELRREHPGKSWFISSSLVAWSELRSNNHHLPFEVVQAQKPASHEKTTSTMARGFK